MGGGDSGGGSRRREGQLCSRWWAEEVNRCMTAPATQRSAALGLLHAPGAEHLLKASALDRNASLF